MLHIARGEFVDEQGRIVTLRGVNFTADVKTPIDDDVRYINTPCSIEEADEHFARIKAVGYNCIRFLYVWDALQPTHPDELDYEYMDFAIALVRKAIVEYDLYVFMDPHQDIWSRFSGGSGAPMWTLHAAGLDPEYFQETHAAMLWERDKKNSTKMLWASNYYRLVCFTMFTLFFGGPEYAPKALINGVNIGTYLKNKFFWALSEFMKRVHAANLGPKLLGWESINEPGHGLIGYEHLDQFPKSKVHVKLGTAPTPVQAMMLGQGIAQRVETYKFTGFGMRRLEVSKLVSPSNSTWLAEEKLKALDQKYGWERSWPGGCIWELHGIYDSASQKLLLPHYFRDIPEWASSYPERLPTKQSVADSEVTSSDEPSSSYQFSDAENLHLFVDKFFVRHWTEFSDLVSSVNPEWFHFMQAPVNAPPPQMRKHYPRYMVPGRVVYTPHFYDGMTLMLKRWRWLNVDTVGVMRDLHSSPLSALKFGDSQIGRSFSKQFEYLKKEGRERLGENVPFLMSEIGIPYDMNNKTAYLTGYWDNQIRAMDSNLGGLEKAGCNYTLWCYAIHNSHEYGDSFQGEDLSIWSKDDLVPELDGKIENGLRAAVSLIRPSPISSAGPVTEFDFDFRAASFRITIVPSVDSPSIFFIPSFHFPPENGLVLIDVTHGHTEREGETLLWHHGTLNEPQTLRVKGIGQFKDSLYSYFEGLHHLCHSLKKSLCY